MKRYIAAIVALAITSTVTVGCGVNEYYSGNKNEKSANSTSAVTSAPSKSAVDTQSQTDITKEADDSQKPEPIKIDYDKIKPNEAGQIMVVMFHNFVETYPKGKNEYTTTFAEFESLLEELYQKNYRLINLEDMLNNNIDVPAGCIPMVFTFDDGTAGQFNLVEQDGQLKANPKSAVGIMEAFNSKHPDFGLKGTFYVNLGVETFNGAGTVQDRLKYLIDKGFEIGNHTKTHVSLPDVKTSSKMLEEVGGNQKLMEEFVPGYKFKAFSLPFGNASKSLQNYVIQGNYQGIEYKHTSIVLVGANPSPSPVSPKFNPYAVPRVRSTGQEKVECDLAWWLDTMAKGSSQYISDGNKDTVVVPESKKQNVDTAKLNGKQLITY
ncbi:polysaccharide deacetylase family protein [Ruminiclostridium josui]|uniref:polysaccharide deacetylase family protein n=1 Tax=Ruminiclostridium josui TaxID=1499 RepID=UPI00046636F3|nr:polysaccharide deacetylase family protein [Ruminiclostridium josui]